MVFVVSARVGDGTADGDGDGDGGGDGKGRGLEGAVVMFLMECNNLRKERGMTTACFEKI